MMRPYLAMFRMSMAQLLQYRLAAIGGVVTQFCFGVIRTQIFAAFLAGGGGPLSASQTSGYVWLGQAFMWLLAPRPDPEIPDLVRSGRVGCELLRPVDIHTFWLARTCARRIAPTALRAAPILAIAMLLGWLQPPASIAACCLVALSLLCAVFLAATLSLLVAQCALWTVAADGLGAIMPALTWFCSGLTVPLPMLPSWLRGILEFLPISGILDKPARIWIGALDPRMAMGAILEQLAWSLALLVVGRMLCRRGLARVEVAGG